MKEVNYGELQEHTEETETLLGAAEDLGARVNGILPGHGDGNEQGPDRLAPADDVKTWRRDGAVTLRMDPPGEEGEEGGAEAPISVMTLMRQAVEKFPDIVALASKVDERWQKVTFREYYDMVIMAAKAFIKLGLEERRSVGIIGFNSPEWFIADLGAIFAGGLATGIYTTNAPEACQAIALSAECNVIVVENDAQLQKILKVKQNLPQLKAIVQYKGTPTDSSVYSWTDFLALGRDVSPELLEQRIRRQAPNKCCTLIYTSGTTGTAKAVMLSHDNLVWTAKMTGRTVRWSYGAEKLISYLPLSHVAAQIVDIYIPMVFGTTLYFAKPDALKGSLGETLQEVQPTGFMGVPRVWEKIQEKMTEVGKSQGFIKRYIAAWAKDIGRRGNIALMNNEPLPWGWTLAKWLVFDKVRAALGLQGAQYCISCAAPVMKDTLDFFLSLNIPLLEVFGLSETTGPHTFALPWACRMTSVGRSMIGCHTKLASVDKDGCGELCLEGRNTFMGYMNDEAMTRASIDEEGWFHSGDIGKIDDDGYIYVTGRLKELLITAGGENVAPVPIEDRIKEQLPCVSNCMLVGDRLKFLSVLLTLKTELSPDTQEPTDRLAPAVIKWCQGLGSDATSVADITDKKDALVMEAIERGISRANAQAISRAQVVQKWTILPREFSVTSGELGPTMKLKRQVVCTKYIKTIDALYAGADDK